MNSISFDENDHPRAVSKPGVITPTPRSPRIGLKLGEAWSRVPNTAYSHQTIQGQQSGSSSPVGVLARSRVNAGRYL